MFGKDKAKGNKLVSDKPHEKKDSRLKIYQHTINSTYLPKKRANSFFFFSFFYCIPGNSIVFLIEIGRKGG